MTNEIKLNDLYPVLMELIHSTNYGINKIKLNNYSLYFLEVKSNIIINDEEDHCDYLFRIFDHHYNDQ